MVAALPLVLGLVKTDCCAASCVFNSRTFCERSSVLAGKSVSYFLCSVLKCLSRSSFFGIAMLALQMRQMVFEFEWNKKVILFPLCVKIIPFRSGHFSIVVSKQRLQHAMWTDVTAAAERGRNALLYLFLTLSRLLLVIDCELVRNLPVDRDP